MAGVLEGIRVLDFGRYIAGPYVATLLAEFGADAGFVYLNLCHDDFLLFSILFSIYFLLSR